MSVKPLTVTDYRVTFRSDGEAIRAVDGVGLRIEPGQIVALVGESGSGKSTLAHGILGLLPETARVEGSITWGDRELVHRPPRELRAIRGAEIAMVFQNPADSLHPSFKVGWQLNRAIRAHGEWSRAAARARILQCLRDVQLPDAEGCINGYPHMLSGGMKQRIMIARALLNSPGLLIADEPTTALDVTVQAQVLQLLRRLSVEHAMSLLLVTHNIAVVSGFADQVLVMQRGRIVESDATAEVLNNPRHPYSQRLLASLPAGRTRTRSAVATPESAGSP